MMRVLPGASLVSTVPKLLYSGTGLSSDVFVKKTPPFAEAHSACSIWNRSNCVALRALPCVRCFARAANGEPTALLLPQFPPLGRENAAHSRRRTAFIQTRVASGIHSYWRFSPGPIFEPADAPPGACFHHLTLCENALAALFAGVVHPLHPLAGIDSARLPLFSGDAISYVSNRRTQSTLNDLNCLTMFLCSTASLLYPCPGWPASAA
jgi:hypothetical protein